MIDAKIRFVSDPVKVADNLKTSLKKRGMKRAVKQAVQPVLAAVKSEAQTVQRYGFLQKSIGLKVVAYPNGAAGIVGPRSKSSYTKGSYTRGKRKGEGRKFQPSKYAHLVEKGTKRSRARPFLQPALDRTKAGYMATVGTLIQQEIDKELSKVK
jgi:HK97 gp10 family phage protein